MTWSWSYLFQTDSTDSSSVIDDSIDEETIHEDEIAQGDFETNTEKTTFPEVQGKVLAFYIFQSKIFFDF